MKKFLAATTVAMTAATSALASGPIITPAPYVAPMVPMPVSYNWTGAYAGVGIGVMRQSDTPVLAGRILSDAQGGQLSILAGYNWQGSGAGVFGAELMIAGGSVDGSSDCQNPAFACGTDVGVMGAFRLRAGIANNNTLFFVTAGVARASIEHSSDNTPGLPGLTAASVNRNAVTLGIGVEHAMANGWNVRGDLEAYRFRSASYTLDGGTNYNASSGRGHAARVTIVRRF